MINENRLLNEFIELVSVPCPSKDEKAEAELIMGKLRELGLEPEMDDVHAKTGGTCGNVWAYVKGNVPDAPVLLFEAHMDSVAPTTGTKVVRKDDVLYSDGTTTLGGDDKVGVASILEAVRALQEDGAAHGDVQLLFTVSEEIGCLGVVNLDKSWIKADYGYCMDIGGDLGEITYAAPKLYDIYVTVKGKAAHAGIAPESGVNAIMLAAQALSKLPAYGRIDEETTFNIGLFNAGVGTNIVCPEAKFVIDMRSLNVAKLEALKDSTIALIRETIEAGGGQVEFDVVEGCPAVEMAKDHPCIQLAQHAAEKLGYPVELKTTGGCSDGNYLCGYGLPCALLATGMSNVHTTEEYLKESDLYGTARWIYETIKTAAAK
ncbi:MAG: M20/M25/M40 family metallo-hydrolase [Phascolarctobacterium sp.]|uniref:M20/M25/M40 family metallo-hydrolase n=1 Tax=Phascolarctobacterium sp. TaxID=2049039 RepID=UPI0026DA96C1|nr:M20/M25/M40 family metallo-hydrolase [Phascolarctobacterium sp.]MDO4922096.1 M20/M25/M40 family metallo-hydrolase [Phascolarctobacterium sp.]